MNSTISKAALLCLLGCTLMKAGTLEQEATTFLNRWLVNGEIKKALRGVSSRGALCVPDPDSGELSSSTPRLARRQLRAAMTTILNTLGQRSSLAEVIAPPPRSGPLRREVYRSWSPILSLGRVG